MNNTVENDIEEEIIDDDEPLELEKGFKYIRYQPQNPTIQTLYDNYKDGDLVLHPSYQRNFVWNKKKASNLIESILLNIPIPIIFTCETNDIEEVIDGQQRLKSIFYFIEGKFPDEKDSTKLIDFKLSKLKILKDLSSNRYIDLDDKLKKKIRKQPLNVVKIISDSTDLDEQIIKFEMFERLNTNITKLNAQELRNCMFRGPYNNFLKKICLSDEFQKILNKPTYKKRMLDVELVLSFCAFYNKNYLQYKGSMKQFLNNDMVLYRNANPTLIKELKEQFKKSVALLNHIFGKDAFRIYSIDKTTKEGGFFTKQLNVGLYLILMYWFTPYQKNQIVPFSDLIREELLSLEIHNDLFIDSLTGSGTTRKNKIFNKFQIWGDTLNGILGYPKDEPRCFSYKLKEDLYKANPICKICKQRINSIDNAEVDHITCYWKGGKTIPENARLTHRICNRMRGAGKEE